MVCVSGLIGEVEVGLSGQGIYAILRRRDLCKRVSGVGVGGWGAVFKECVG